MHDSFRDLERAARDISRSLNVYTGIAAQLQKSTSVFASLQASIAEQLASNKSLFGSASEALSKASLATLTTTNFRDLGLANERLTELVSRAAISNSTLSQVFAEHNTLRASLESIATRPSMIDLLSSMDTTRLLHTSLSSQYRLLGLEASSIGRLVGASNVFANDLTATFGKFTRSYRDVIECIPRISERQATFIAKYPPVEYSLELDVLERISIDTDEGVKSTGLPTVDGELASFDDRLLTLINGARESLKSDNPDRARHVTTSVRELCTQVLHRLAPDDEIKKWSEDGDHYHNGRPTRRARLLYICRRFSCDPLTKFVEEDVRAAITLIDSLNAGTHVVHSQLTDFQLEAIVYRIEALALFLLKISRGA